MLKSYFVEGSSGPDFNPQDIGSMMTLVWRTRKMMSMGVIISILCSIHVITPNVFQITGKCMVFCQTPRRLCVRRRAPSPPSIVYSSFFRQPLTHLDQTTQQLLKCTLHTRVFQYFVFNVLIKKYIFFCNCERPKDLQRGFCWKSSTKNSNLFLFRRLLISRKIFKKFR